MPYEGERTLAVSELLHCLRASGGGAQAAAPGAGWMRRTCARSSAAGAGPTRGFTTECLQGFTKFLKKNAKIAFELPNKEKKGKKEKKAEEDGE